MGKTSEKKNPFYEGEAGKCKCCQRQYHSILRHLAKNKICPISYSETEINDLRFQSKSDPSKLERILVRRKERYQRDKRVKEQLKNCNRISSGNPFINKIKRFNHKLP